MDAVLATQCPHCHTLFKVANDQLTLHGGLVRCGICQHVFNGVAQLMNGQAENAIKPLSTSTNTALGMTQTDVVGDTYTPSPVSRERVGERARETGRNINEHSKKEKQELNHSHSEANTLSPPQNPFRLRKLPLQGQSVLQAQCMHYETPATPLSRETGEGANFESRPVPTDVEDIEQLSFIRQAQTKKRGKWFWSLGIFMLLLMLAGQITYQFRDLIAATYPASKKTLTTLCGYLRCQIQLPAQLDALSYEADALHTLPREHTFEFSLLLRNYSALTQAWPYIELTLKNPQRQTVLKRVFSPKEYLNNSAAITTGFIAHHEHAVKLYFEMNQITASDYAVAIFYP